MTQNVFFWGCPHGVMVKALDYWVVVREFELQSWYHVHFRTNTQGKDIKPFIFPAMGLKVSLLSF